MDHFEYNETMKLVILLDSMESGTRRTHNVLLLHDKDEKWINIGLEWYFEAFSVISAASGVTCYNIVCCPLLWSRAVAVVK